MSRRSFDPEKTGLFRIFAAGCLWGTIGCFSDWQLRLWPTAFRENMTAVKIAGIILVVLSIILFSRRTMSEKTEGKQ